MFMLSGYNSDRYKTENKVKISCQTQCLNLSGQVLYLSRRLKREATCFGVMKHVVQDFVKMCINLHV